MYILASVFTDLLSLSFECIGTQITLFSCFNIVFTLLWKATFLITVKYTWAQRQHTDFFPCLSQFKAAKLLSLSAVVDESQSVCTRERDLHLPIRFMYSYVPKIQNNSTEVIRLAVISFTDLHFTLWEKSGTSFFQSVLSSWEKHFKIQLLYMNISDQNFTGKWVVYEIDAKGNDFKTY